MQYSLQLYSNSGKISTLVYLIESEHVEVNKHNEQIPEKPIETADCVLELNEQNS